MRSMKVVIILMMIGLLTLGLSASASEKTYELTYSNTDSAENPISLGAYKLAELVESRSNGRLKIIVLPNSELGNETEQYKSVRLGIQGITGGTSGGLAAYYPPLGVFDAGYIFKDYDHQKKVTNGSIGKEMIDNCIKESGIRILGFYYQGERHLTTKNKVIKEPSDLKGVKIRTPDVRMYAEVINGMGASATPIAFDEVYTSLQLGVAEGQENPANTILENKFYEVQKYIILTGHMSSVGEIAMSEKKFQELPKDLQDILLQATLEAIEYQEKLIIEKEKTTLDQLKSKGMIVIQPDVEKFRAAVQKYIIPIFEDEWGKGLYEKVSNF